MSETLRDLVVSLSLQTDNFTRNIKSVSRQIAEAESQFRLAAAGVEGFERTTTGLATQLSTLERRLSLQKDMVGQYQRALEAANNKLTECYNRQNDYAQRLETAKAAQQSLKEQVAAAAQQVRTYIRPGGENRGENNTKNRTAENDASKTQACMCLRPRIFRQGRHAALAVRADKLLQRHDPEEPQMDVCGRVRR